jgi:hypothetical protein
MRSSTLPSLATLAALIAAAPIAQATGVDPALDTWTCLGTCGTLAADGDITLSPYGSPRYAYLTTNGSAAHGVSPLAIVESGGGGAEFSQTNGSSYTSAPFTLADGQDVRGLLQLRVHRWQGFRRLRLGAAYRRRRQHRGVALHPRAAAMATSRTWCREMP